MSRWEESDLQLMNTKIESSDCHQCAIFNNKLTSESSRTSSLLCSISFFWASAALLFSLFWDSGDKWDPWTYSTSEVNSSSIGIFPISPPKASIYSHIMPFAVPPMRMQENLPIEVILLVIISAAQVMTSGIRYDSGVAAPNNNYIEWLWVL